MLTTLAVREPERGRMKAVNRMLARDPGRAAPRGPRLGAGMGDQLQQEAIRVVEGNDGLRLAGRRTALARSLIVDAVSRQALDPEADGARQNRKGGDGHLPRADAPAPRAGPGEERDDASRSADLVAVIEVVGLGIVEIDGPLDEAEAEHPSVEVD